MDTDPERMQRYMDHSVLGWAVGWAVEKLHNSVRVLRLGISRTGREGFEFCEWGRKELSEGEKVQRRQRDEKRRGEYIWEMLMERAELVEEVFI